MSYHIDPCAELYLENIKIYVYLSFLNTKMAQAVGIFPRPLIIHINAMHAAGELVME